jgi:ribonuclease Y
MVIYGVTIVVVGICAALAGYILRKKIAEGKILSAEKQARKIIEEAELQVEAKKKEAILEAKEKLYKAKAEFEEETKKKLQEISNLERKVAQKEENLERKIEILERREREIQNREREIQNREKSIKEKEEELKQIIEEERNKLEKISGLTAEAAKKMLIENLENEAKLAAAKRIKQIEDEAKEIIEEKAKRIISIAISRCSIDHTIASTSLVYTLPNEEVKGKIIGKEGRNIRALEATLGVDIIIDDTPETVVISSFDGLRREIAKLALDELIADGRIHPARIEETVEKIKKQIDSILIKEGEKAALEVGVVGLHPEIIKLLGKLKFRTSYSQNVLSHSIEVAHLAGIMAAELGLNQALFKRCGLLHDIGKAIDQEVEGAHTSIGADVARKYNEHEKVVQAILLHHSDDIQRPLEAVLVQAADAISGARPGARGDTKEAYIKRIKKLEEITSSFSGVEKVYAIQAGREIRIMVDHDEIDDVQASQLARDIAKRIEQEIAYPGEIKVTVIRERRFTEYAR